MTLRYGRLFFVLCILSILLLGCTSEDDATQKIRIAHFPNATHAQALVMRHQGLLENYLDEDVEIEFVVFNAGSSEIEAFFSDHVDLGYIGPIPAINGHIKSKGDILIVGGSASSGAIILANINSEINTVKDLDDKRVALPQYGNTQHIALLNLLKLNDLMDATRGGTVELVFTLNAQLKTLFESNEVDAAFVPEPWASELITSGLARPILDSHWADRSATTVVIADKNFLENHGDYVEAFLRAHLEATEFIINNPEESKKIITEELQLITNHTLSQEAIDDAFQNIEFGLLPPIDSIELHMNWFYEAGFIDEMVSMEALINLEILNQIKK